ncbi:MAG: TadE family protein, partial [Candidatus Sulfotelmatobacter sp.]
MIRAAYVRTCSLGKQLVHTDRAAQLVEFAVSLPLLVLFVVGIFDFSAAFTQKQKLTNVARDAARVAAADPVADVGNLTSGLPSSITDAFRVIDSYLTANNLNDCGLASKTPSRVGVTW